MFNMSPQVVRSRLATLFIENLRDILDQKGVNQKQLSENSYNQLFKHHSKISTSSTCHVRNGPTRSDGSQPQVDQGDDVD